MQVKRLKSYSHSKIWVALLCSSQAYITMVFAQPGGSLGIGLPPSSVGRVVGAPKYSQDVHEEPVRPTTSPQGQMYLQIQGLQRELKQTRGQIEEVQHVLNQSQKRYDERIAELEAKIQSMISIDAAAKTTPAAIIVSPAAASQNAVIQNATLQVAQPQPTLVEGQADTITEKPIPMHPNQNLNQPTLDKAAFSESKGALIASPVSGALPPSSTTKSDTAPFSINAASNKSTNQSSQSMEAVSSDANGTEKIYFDAAYDFYKANELIKGNQAMLAFLKRYPQGQYAGDAHFYLGNIQAQQGNISAAAQSFRVVVQRFPSSPQAPNALLKLGDMQKAMDDIPSANLTFQSVIAQYPSTPAAQIAQKQLSSP